MTTPDTAAIRARLQAATWQPIETAPRDRRLELWTPGQDGGSRLGRWDDDRYVKKPRPYWRFDGSMRSTQDRESQPTHWRLPSNGPSEENPSAALLEAYDARGEEIERLRALATVPLLQTIERILDEHSAWIARPDHDVARAVALAAGIAGMEAARGAQSDYERHLEAQIAALTAAAESARAGALEEAQAAIDKLWSGGTTPYARGRREMKIAAIDALAALAAPATGDAP